MGNGTVGYLNLLAPLLCNVRYAQPPTPLEMRKLIVLSIVLLAAAVVGRAQITKYGYEVTDDHFIETEHFLGLLYVAEEGWTYSYDINAWLWVDETSGDLSTQYGIWGYVQGIPTEVSDQVDETIYGYPENEGMIETGNFLGYLYAGFAPWAYANALETWLYLSEGEDTDLASNPNTWVFFVNASPRATTTTQLTQYGITWTFAEPVTYGKFVTGDYWVVGPVEVISITNDLNSPDYTPRDGQNGSMVNPLVGHDRGQQGYEEGRSSYVASLNAGRPNGDPLSAENPLILAPGSSLVSTVSWLYNSPTDKEPGTPNFSSGTPRSATRSASVLTVLEEAPPANAFRPAYSGTDKTVRYTWDDLDKSLLLELTPPSGSLPNVQSLENAMARPWIDHVFEWTGAFLHPTMNMPNYGRDMGNVVNNTSLMLHLDFSKLPGQPSKDKLLINLVQYGIDLTGIADNGGGWRANGGHALGRKWPILFAGLMLDDAHMKDVGNWPREYNVGVEFQEDQNHFYISQADVDLTHSGSWAPDSRDVTAGTVTPYEVEHIGIPEWGIRHDYRPTSDNGHFDANYRPINGAVTPGIALSALLMDARSLWNHEAFFDYNDRYMQWTGGEGGANDVSAFVKGMWDLYRKDYPPIWEEDEIIWVR